MPMVRVFRKTMRKLCFGSVERLNKEILALRGT